MSVYDEFAWRELIHTASDGVEEVLAKQQLTAYIGFDPTAASLHVGSLLPIMALARLQRFGHHPIGLLGGGTGLIGDPSGKTTERKLLSKDDIAANLAGIRAQLSRFLDFEKKDNAAQMIDNADWLTTISITDFLRDVGKHFTVNQMLAKESVKRRIEQEDGISFTEFGYSLLQAFDFLELYDRYHCEMQLGGSDQWGNITAGMDLIRRTRGARAYGLVMPLVVNAAGTKFGKTESGAVWLDPNLTSPFKYYQFWFNTDDRDVVKYLKYFTWLARDEIAALQTSFETAPEAREAQRTLAREVTRQTHGEDALRNAERASAFLFGSAITATSAGEIADIFSDAPSSQLSREALQGEGMPLTEALMQCGVAKSKGEAKRALESGGISINNVRVSDVQRRLTLDDSIEGRYIVLRKGQKGYHLVQVG